MQVYVESVKDKSGRIKKITLVKMWKRKEEKWNRMRNDIKKELLCY